ncbi:hypothetical protein KBB27_00420 [Patescibacteria group bacterium]|nr:hypothetical protein [Patescibacteria group bacterium]
MKNVKEIAQRSQEMIERARILWTVREEKALIALLERRVFKSVLPPFYSFGVHSLAAFCVPKYVSAGVFMDMDAQTGVSIPIRDSPRFHKCDVPMGKSAEWTQELLHRYLTNYPERPASFQDLAVSDVWKAFAGPNGDAPRLMLPGVMVSFGSGEPLIPVIDYIRPEFSDASEASLDFVLRGVSPAQLKYTGARALFVGR